MSHGKIQCEGWFFDGKSSSRKAASLTLENSLFTISLPSGESIQFTPSEVEISSRVGNIPRALVFAESSRFETNDNQSIDLMRKSLGQGEFAFKLEGSWRLALASAACMVLVFSALYFVVLPSVSETVAQFFPDEWAAKISQPTKVLLDKIYFSPSRLEGEDKKRLEGAIARTAKAFPHLNLIFFPRSGGALGANAFALPDGTIYVTDEIATMASSEEHLVAILFHEAAHVEKKHSTIQLIESSALSLLLFAVVGADLSNLPLLILGNRYSRSYESEADQIAMLNLHKQGITPIALATMLNRLSKDGERENGSLSFLSTHPITADRVKAIEAWASSH